MASYFLCFACFFASSLTLAQNFNFVVPPWEQIGSVIGPVPEYRPLCELVILPSTMLEMNEGETLFLNCKANCRDLPLSLHWEDNAGRRVPEVQPSSRRYSNGARYWLGFLRLEIGNLQPEHEGNYLCKGYSAGNWIIRTTYLKIRPRYPATTVTPRPTPTTTTTTPPMSTTTVSTTTTTRVTTISSTASTTSSHTPTSTSSTTTALEETTTTQTLPVAARIAVSSSAASNSSSSGSEATSSSISADDPPSEDFTRNPPQSNAAIDITRSNLVTDANGQTTEATLPSATLPNSSPSETSSTDLSLQNSSFFNSRERIPDESPSPSDETSLLEASAEESATENPTLEISLATTAAVSTEPSESSDVVDFGTDANSSRSLLKNVDTDLEASDVNLEENIRTEIINESIQNARVGVVNVIPDFAAVPINQRKKRDINALVNNDNSVNAGAVDVRNGSQSALNNASIIFDDGIYTCSGFGPKAIATIAILGALCLILIYAFILVLCVQRTRRKKTVEISEKKLEEGEGEGIEIKEKPENVPPGPNGRISHCEETLTTVDINNTEGNADEGAAAKDEESKKEPVTLAEAETHNTSEAIQAKENSTKETTGESKQTPEEVNEVKPVLPPPPPAPYLDHEPQEDKEINEDPEEAGPVNEVSPETSPPKAPSPPPSVPQGEQIELEVSPQQHVPVFDEPEPQEMIVKESIVNGANVELEDKSVDTVELESQDIEEPFDTTPPMISPEAEELPKERLSPVPLLPDVKSHHSAEERLSNGLEMSYQNEQNLAPERDEMTKSIEDLPPPPPIPPHRTPPPPPPQADEMNAGLEAPDVVSSNVTAV